jgi:hypothetical protein
VEERVILFEPLNISKEKCESLPQVEVITKIKFIRDH